MIVCPKCSKENQDHYKFCLGCGAELPRETAPKAFVPQTPNQGIKVAGRGAGSGVASGPFGVPSAGAGGAPGAASPGTASSPPMPQPVSAPTVPQGQGHGGAAAPNPVTNPTVTCPQCGHVNAPSNVFCGSCGFRLATAAKAAPASTAAAPSAAGGGIILTALRADGSEAGTYNLPGGTTMVGRDTGGIFAGDSYLSPRHATFRQTPGKLFVKDDASLNGVYKKLARDIAVELVPNDIFRIGQEIIRFETLAPMAPTGDGVERLGSPSKGYIGRVALVIGRDATGNAYPVPETGLHLGRERGDVLFPEDGYVSGLHCRLSWQNGMLYLTDLGRGP